MDRDQLAARHTAAIRRHWRTMVDNGGTPPAGLLDELAGIAEVFAADCAGAWAEGVAVRVEPPPDGYEQPGAAERREARVSGEDPAMPAPRRRHAARGSTK